MREVVLSDVVEEQVGGWVLGRPRGPRMYSQGYGMEEAFVHEIREKIEGWD